MSAPWRCPVCQARQALSRDGRRWACRSGHSFDVARAGYVNFSTVGHRRTRQAGDVEQMVNVRGRFLATGAFDPLTNALVEVVTQENPNVLLDVGCGDGRHTRSMTADIVMGIDAAKTAAAAAARAHPRGWYGRRTLRTYQCLTNPLTCCSTSSARSCHLSWHGSFGETESSWPLTRDPPTSRHCELSCSRSATSLQVTTAFGSPRKRQTGRLRELGVSLMRCEVSSNNVPLDSFTDHGRARCCVRHDDFCQWRSP